VNAEESRCYNAGGTSGLHNFLDANSGGRVAQAAHCLFEWRAPMTPEFEECPVQSGPRNRQQQEKKFKRM